MKKILGIRPAPRGHWVGDGFPVRSLFSHDRDAEALSPFLLLDYAGPARFEPASAPRGVGEHPHRGFETVTIVYQGEVAHRDSTGAGGTIGPGDVQWMTAASGVLHDEFHSPALTQQGGMLEMVQLWVNLPAAHKMSAPKYQSLLNADIPVAGLPGGAGTLRVIAGEYAGQRGAATTHTPLDVWDLRLAPGRPVELPVDAGRTLALVLLHGDVLVNGEQPLHEAEFALLERSGRDVTVQARDREATLLVLSGEPIDEPVAAYGPFVMNDEAGIRQAIRDFRQGRFGRLANASETSAAHG